MYKEECEGLEILLPSLAVEFCSFQPRVVVQVIHMVSLMNILAIAQTGKYGLALYSVSSSCSWTRGRDA